MISRFPARGLLRSQYYS